MSSAAADTARASCEDHGDVVHCDGCDEMLEAVNDMANERLQVMTDRDDWFLEHMHSHGPSFLWPRTNVSNGGKVAAANHALPTKRAGRCTGGPCVGKFPKAHSYQKGASDGEAAMIGEFGLRLCTQEGVVGHAERCNIRIRRYAKRKCHMKKPQID